MIHFACPTCAKELNALETLEGQTLTCPYCAGLFTVPAPILEVLPADDIQAAPSPLPPMRLPEASARQPVPRFPQKTAIRYRCPKCSNVQPREIDAVTIFGWIYYGLLLGLVTPLCITGEILTGLMQRFDGRLWGGLSAFAMLLSLALGGLFFKKTCQVCSACGTRMETYADR